MFKRIIAAAGIGLASTAGAQQLVPIGTAEITVPSGWSEAKKEKDRVVFRSPDGHQQVTISVMRFGADASFDQFKKLCAHRIEAEKKELGDGFIQPDEAFEDVDMFGMFYSGGDKNAGRVFSGYLSLSKRELITVYVEGLGVGPVEHVETFKAFVKGLKRKKA